MGDARIERARNTIRRSLVKRLFHTSIIVVPLVSCSIEG